MKYSKCKAAALATIAVIGLQAALADNLTQYVDPMIGSGGHGHVFVGANVPFGFVQLGPTEPVRGWDWCSGYHHSDSIILGFSHTHLSGTGMGDLGDIMMLPTRDPGIDYSRFRHDNESVRPGYYRVKLDDTGTEAELTATNRVGVHRYHYAPSDSAYVLINNLYGIGWDRATDVEMHMVNDSTISGHRYSRGWAADQRVFFYARFSRPMTRCELTDTVTTCVFAPSASPLVVKVGMSPNSIEAACGNLLAEVGDKSFDRVCAEADSEWNSHLSRITISTPDPRVRHIFYTAMYHAMIAPVTYSDVNDAQQLYSIFSLWDTYRAAHPLYTLICSDLQDDFIGSFLDIYRRTDRLPVWHLHGNETDCMVGNPGVIVMGDMFTKGFVKDSDRQTAYKAMQASALRDKRSLWAIKKYGYIPYDGEECGESVAKGLEYAIADDAIAKVGKLMGDTTGYFSRRGQAYRIYYDPETGFMRGLSIDGKRRPGEFNPFVASHRVDDYCEGNAWQYLWLVPHDPHGLIELLGGEERFVNRLDSLFVVEGDLGADASPDISGLIGQYAHGNEPTHHVLYLYNYAGVPHKAAPLLRQVMDTLYDDAPDGLCGNEDVGQMSSWYILSSMGLYQVEPVGGKYVLGTPILDRAVMNVGNGRTFTIEAIDNSPENIYIQSATLNGRPYTKGYIMFDDMAAGGELVLTMGPEPSSFATAAADRP